MLTPLTLDGRSLSQTTRVADLRGTDLVPIVRPSEPLPFDQNVSIRADRLQALLGTGSVTPAPATTLYDVLGIHTDGAATQRLVNEVADAAVRVPNLRPVGHAVTADYVSTPGWGPGSSSLADLPVDTLFVGTTAITIFSVAGRFRTYVVADDPQGTLSVWRDGRLSGTRVLARWVLSDAPQAVATAYTSIDGTSYVWTLRQFASAYVGTPLTIQFFQARTAAVHPAPTEGGDAVDWEAISPQNITAPAAPQPATATRAGVVKIGSGVGVTTDGTISVPAQVYGLIGNSFDRNVAMLGSGVVQAVAIDASSTDNFFAVAGPNVYGTGQVNNRFGYFASGNRYGNGMQHCVFGGFVKYSHFGINMISCQIGDNCQNITIGDNCTRVQVYNCNNFTIPAGTTDAVYRNNLLVSVPVVVPLYTTTGQNEDAAMTQKATSDALATRFNNRGAWAASTLYQPNDSVSYNGATYYRVGVAFTSGAAFALGNWTAFSSGISMADLQAYEAINVVPYLFTNLGAELVLTASATAQNPNPYDSIRLVGGGNFLLNLAISGSNVFYGVRVPKGGLAATVTLASNNTLDGAGTFTLAPGEWRIIALGTANTYTTYLIGGTPVDTFAPLPYAASIAVDFNAETVRTIAATGNVAYGASLNVALLKTKEHYLTNTTGAAITLTFPAGWSFFPGPAPTTLAAGKQAVLTLRSLGTTDSTIKAAYVAQA